LIQSISKNLSKFVSESPWPLRHHCGCATGCDRSKKTAIVRYSMQRGCAARPTTEGGNRAIAPPEVFKNMFSC